MKNNHEHTSPGLRRGKLQLVSSLFAAPKLGTGFRRYVREGVFRKMKMLLLVFLLLATPALALEAGEALPDAGQEARAVKIGEQLRCMVCQAESINDSGAGLAKDLRKAVREQVKAGKTDEQIYAYMQTRYGDYVLMKPPVKPATLALWLAPWVFLLVGIGVVARRFMVNKKGAHP